jgi:hypothetical protein
MEKITISKWIRFLLYIFGTGMKVAVVCRDAAFIRKQGKSLNEKTRKDKKGTVLRRQGDGEDRGTVLLS